MSLAMCTKCETLYADVSRPCPKCGGVGSLVDFPELAAAGQWSDARPERETVTVRGRELFLDDEKVCVEVGDGDWSPLVIADSAPSGPLMFLSDIFKAFLAERQRQEQAESDVRWLLAQLKDDHYTAGCKCDMCQVLRRIDARYPQEKADPA